MRFDPAGATAGKFRGAVFTDHVPTYDLMTVAQAKTGLAKSSSPPGTATTRSTTVSGPSHPSSAGTPPG
ncbi:hypothetical protein K7G98_36810 [Saccharothrix sp. MB29]|nr:hypothetical protein [Saccharothrix sp. MB29]